MLKTQTTFLYLITLFLSICIYAEENIKPVKISSKDVLFLAHFNNNVKPEIGNIKGMAYQATITSGARGVAFKNSFPRAECLDISTFRSFMALPGAGNINVKQGTLQFWVKPMWGRKGYIHSVFFKFQNNPRNRGGIEWKGQNTFFIQKPPHKNIFQLSHAQQTIKKLVPFGSKWHQIATTWSTQDKKIKFYVDGEFVAAKKYLYQNPAPQEIIFGSPDTHCGRSLIDEVRIISRVLNAEEIKQDYLAQQSGCEFTSPKLKTTSNIRQFTPEMPVDSPKTNFELENVTLPIYYSSQAPVINANLNDKTWSSAIFLPQMLNRNGKPAEVKTQVKLLFDTKNIYIGAEVNEPKMNTITARFDQRDLAIHSDDCLEFVLKPSGSDKAFYHFAVNSIGTIYDSRNGKRNFDAKGIKVRTRHLQDKWILEMSIPFADLKSIPPQAGSIWGARFCRERHNIKTEYSSIPTTPSGSFSAPAFLGKLSFKGSQKSKFAISAQINSNTFMPGLNKYHLTFSKALNKKINAQICVNYFNKKNELTKSDSKQIALDSGTSIIEIPVKVTDDSISRIGITIQNAKNNSIYNTILQRNFITVSPSVTETAKELPYLLSSMQCYSDVKHPLYSGTKKALVTVNNAILDYQHQLTKAIKNDTTITKKQWDKVVSVVNGFNKFKEYRRYLLWQTSPWEKGSPKALAPINYQENPVFNFVQAGNERETVCFIISGLLCRKRLDLRVVPHVIDQNGKFIPDRHFTVYTEPFLDHMGQENTSALIKVPGNIVTITPGNSQRVWLVFNSRKVPAGNYQTKVSIKPLNNYSIPNREIPVYLRIFRFNLPETQDWPLDCFFWRSMLGQLDETAMLKMLHKYHVKWAMTESHKYIHGFKKNGLQLNGWRKKGFDIQKLKHANNEFFETAKKLKMKIVFAWGTGDSVKWHEIMIKRLKTMGFGYEDFIFHGGLRDEFLAKDIPRNAEFRKKMHLANPKAQFMATLITTPPPSGASWEQIKQAGLLEFFKVWAIASGAKPQLFERIHNNKLTVWAYRCQLNMQTRSILDYYRFFPWFGYLKKLDGVAFWTFNSNRGDGFDHRDGYDDGITLIDNNHKPIPTKQLEAVREGLEDVAYMDILKKALTKAEKHNPNKNYSAYKKLLKEIPIQIMRDKSQDALDNWRIQVGEAIEQLNK
jgi:hypothetical protein